MNFVFKRDETGREVVENAVMDKIKGLVNGYEAALGISGASTTQRRDF
jgi:hypothetical protein